jgi:hypothetical protein
METSAKRNLTIAELRKLVHEGDASDPLVFLEALVGGQDVRKANEALRLAVEINDLTGGEPSPEDWAELLECLYNSTPWQPVGLSDSLAAAKTLAEYLHPKRKQIDMTGLDGTVQGAQPAPLTAEEVDMFLERFNEHF